MRSIMKQSILHELKLGRTMLCVVVIVLAAMSAVRVPAFAKSAQATRPTIVLVHGAWAGPSGWDEVVAALHKDGYNTAAPTLDLMSIAGDVAIVRAALDIIGDPKILVGHSYGGMGSSNPATRPFDALT